MDKLFKIVGNIAAAIGILICLMAGVARLTGYHYVLGYEAITLFIGGTSLMVMACLAKLHLLSSS